MLEWHSSGTRAMSGLLSCRCHRALMSSRSDEMQWVMSSGRHGSAQSSRPAIRSPAPHITRSKARGPVDAARTE